MANSKMKEKFYQQVCKIKANEPDASLTVLQFIVDFTCHATQTEEEYEIIRSTFRAGYCWHFAHILKDTFRRGEVCWAAPFGHFVWVDDNKVPYDIEGLYDGEALYFIPESYLGKYVHDFTHIPGYIIPEVTDDIIIGIIRKYEEDYNLPEQEVTIHHLPTD